MKRNLLFNQATAIGKRLAMVLTMLLTVGIGQAWGETATYTLNSSNNGGSVTTGNVSWSIASGAITEQNSNCKLTGTITVTLPAGATLNKVSIAKSNTWGSGATVTFKTGSTTLNTFSNSGDYTLTTNKDKLTYTFSKSGTSSKNAWVKSITVDYTVAAATTYKVTYDKNGATSGTVPTDATSYNNGATVTVKPNSGTLAKTGYTFGGWNTKADGTGTNYTAGSGTFKITANTTLYAKWNLAAKYTVKFYKTSTTFESVTETSAGAGVTPPTMEEECGDWTFQGWSESQSNSETSTTELELVTLTDGKYYPTEDVNLYPVYTKSEGGGGTVSWNKITTAPADWSGEYLIVNSDYAMTSDFYSSGEFKGASVTVSNNQVTSSPSDKMIWIVEKNGSNAQYSFKNKSTGTYANITGTSSTNAALSSSVIWFTISSSSTSGVWKINSVTYSARCFSYYSTNNSFRTYANSSNTTGSLYKKEGSGSTTYYYSYPQCTAELTHYLLRK